MAFSIGSSQLIGPIKSVTLLVLKKSHYYSLRFSTKNHRLKLGALLGSNGLQQNVNPISEDFQFLLNANSIESSEITIGDC